MTTNTRRLLAGFVSIAALATASACSSGSSGGLDFGSAGVGGGAGSGSGGETGSGATGGGTDSSGGSNVNNGGSTGGTDVAGGATDEGGSDGDSGATDVAGGDGAGSADADGAGSEGASADGAGDGGETDVASGEDDEEAQPALSGTLERVVDSAADPILTAGNALLPGASGATGAAGGALDGLASRGDAALNPAGTVVVSNQPVLGDGASGAQQLAGVSALSSPSAQGEVLTANVAENGNVLTAGLNTDPVLAAAQDAAGSAQNAVGGAQSAVIGAIDGQNLASASLGNASVGGTDAVLGLGALSPTQPTGTVATAGLASGGQTAVANIAGYGLTEPAASTLQGVAPGGLNAALGAADQTLVGAGVGSATTPQGTLATAGALTPAGDPLAVSVNGSSLTGGQQLLAGQGDTLALGGNPALVGAGALTPTQPTGSVATAGAASGGQAATVGLSGASLLQ